MTEIRPTERPLSPRESQCLSWAARGHSSRDIGRQLGITARTVDFHTHNAVRKLGAANRRHAVAIVAERTLIPAP